MDKICVGVYDFISAPYALGDVVTWIINVLITAYDSESRGIELILLTGPKHVCSTQRSVVNELNYYDHFSNLYPVFLSCPNIRAITVYNANSKKIGLTYVKSRLSELRKNNDLITWPSLGTIILQKWVYTSHSTINKFYHRNGFIPLLIPDSYFSLKVRETITNHLQGKKIVTVNIRIRKNYSDYRNNDADLSRDSSPEAWNQLFSFCEKEHPDVVFVILGGFSEWDHQVYRRINVFIPRTYGLHVGHEIAFIFESIFYMGSSSGFSQIVTFTRVPYVITNMQPSGADAGEIEYGKDSHFPFAADNQNIGWGIETGEYLIRMFESLYVLNNEE